jgi:hypothetical protein
MKIEGLHSVYNNLPDFFPVIILAETDKNAVVGFV